MVINQFYDKGLAHASYAIIRTGKMVVIDPGRDPQPYYNFATLHEADIVGVIETHPHADFISSHLEIHQTTGATLYVSKLTGAEYPHESFDEGDVIELDDIKLKALNTPGHSPDSICILLENENGNDIAVFTGDTLFAGDVGRPDLREDAGSITAKKEELAKAMYHSTRDKLMHLPKSIVVYPAHGPGSLCGKNMSPDLQSTIGRELRGNYALQLMSELEFIKILTTGQPFVPKYFGYNVELNKKGAPTLKESISKVTKLPTGAPLEKDILIIDTRPGDLFKNGHLKGAVNLQNGTKFETWLGSIVGPEEKFYLIAASDNELDEVIKKAAKIGYEDNINGALKTPENATEKTPDFDELDFKNKPKCYTVVDARNWGEINDGLLFKNALTIPLPELRERLNEIPINKPIVVHCAAGYRSAAAASIIAGKIKNVQVYDLGEAVSAVVNS